MYRVKKISELYMGDYINIVANAYPGFKIHSHEDKVKLKERYLKIQNEEDTVNIYGVFKDKVLLGGMRLHDFYMNLRGIRTFAGGIGLVAVDIMHKKEKIAKEIVSYFLKHYRERGVCVAMLYPFRPDFYKQMGFGFGTKMNQYKIKPENLPGMGNKENVFLLGEDDREELMNCYNRFMGKTHGMIEKSDMELNGMFRNPEFRIVGYKKNGIILGYAMFEFKAVKQDNMMLNDIQVREFIYETTEAMLGILSFFHSQLDQINRIIINTQDENFHFLLNDPRNGTDNVFPHVYHESNAQGIGIMYRIINVKEFFNKLAKHNFGDQTCKLRLCIEDSFLLENQCDITIDFINGFPMITESRDYDIQVNMDISDFSSLAVGAVNFKVLYQYGLASINSEENIEIVDTIFNVRKKPICTTPF